MFPSILTLQDLFRRVSIHPASNLSRSMLVIPYFRLRLFSKRGRKSDRDPVRSRSSFSIPLCDRHSATRTSRLSIVRQRPIPARVCYREQATVDHGRNASMTWTVGPLVEVNNATPPVTCQKRRDACARNLIESAPAGKQNTSPSAAPPSVHLRSVRVPRRPAPSAPHEADH